MTWQSEVERVSQLVDREWMSAPQAMHIGKLWEKLRPKRILEIGTFKGTGACYLGAMAKLYGGYVITVDFPKNNERSETRKVLAQEQLDKCGLDNVTVDVHAGGAEGWLKEYLQRKGPTFDFIFIDGGHYWLNVCAQLSMSMAALRQGGWVLMDDVADDYPGVKLAWEVVVPQLCPIASYRYTRGRYGFFMKIGQAQWYQYFHETE